MTLTSDVALPRTILVPLDGSELAEQALPHAIALARLADARLVLARVPETIVVPVISGGVWITREVEPHDARERASRYLAETSARHGLGDLAAQLLTPPHPVAAGLLQAVEESGAELVAMTTHGHSGIGRWVFGSIADKMIHAAPTPVFLVRASDTGPREPGFRRVVVPLDGSPLAEAVLPLAVALAGKAGARLTLVRVPTTPGLAATAIESGGWPADMLEQARQEAEAYVEEEVALLSSGGASVESAIAAPGMGGVADGILAFVAQSQADCIVMSTHGRSGIGRWVFGSVADRLLRSATVPVWLVRATLGTEAA